MAPLPIDAFAATRPQKSLHKAVNGTKRNRITREGALLRLGAEQRPRAGVQGSKVHVQGPRSARCRMLEVKGMKEKCAPIASSLTCELPHEYRSCFVYV